MVHIPERSMRRWQVRVNGLHGHAGWGVLVVCPVRESALAVCIIDQRLLRYRPMARAGESFDGVQKFEV